ncbi:uncharacterized protein LOC117925137 isoform X2 [Vitis riparia]|uniref:uncharacterized protein LOC117925137 isoform X2 n=1 Tax=Vitis riparia TaxID=96939 RepID=UPI00155B2D9E|nr:uncharacterized protein LOC117925137 isoform X2 [Vitis riparia]
MILLIIVRWIKSSISSREAVQGMKKKKKERKSLCLTLSWICMKLSVGANRVRLQGTKLRESCKDGDVEGWKAALKQLKKEHATLKEKLDTYFQLVKQLGSEKKTMWHPNEGQVDMLAKNQLMKMAITKDEKVEFGHKDMVKKGTGKEPGKVVTEEEAVKVVSDEESVQMVAK